MPTDPHTHYLTKFYDRNVPPIPADEWDAEAFLVTERQRVQRTIVLAHLVLTHKRRIDPATPDELSQDKLMARSLRNRLITMADRYGLERSGALDTALSTYPPTTNKGKSTPIAIEAAQIEWGDWILVTYAPYMAKTLKQLAAQAHQATKRADRKIFNKYTNLILNELSQVAQVYNSVYKANLQVA